MANSQWIDEKYIGQIRVYLSHFKQQSATVYTFRCNICGDSKKQQNKTRGYFFLHDRQYFFKCHNCNLGLSFRQYLQKQFPDVYREYLMDLMRHDQPAPKVPATSLSAMLQQVAIKSVGLPNIASLPSDHVARLYCDQRQLPQDALKHLYYTDEWTPWLKSLEWSYEVKEDHAPRLVLPWYDRNKQLLGAQARRIDVSGKDGRYVTFKSNHDVDKLYGWDRLNLQRVIYIVEGPLDSWFLSNAVASMDSDLLRLRDKYFSSYAAVYVWDNEPRNAAVVANLARAIKADVPVVVWPSYIVEKDVNDMFVAGYDVPKIIHQHTFRGLRAKLEFLRWKRHS